MSTSRYMDIGPFCQDLNQQQGQQHAQLHIWQDSQHGQLQMWQDSQPPMWMASQIPAGSQPPTWMTSQIRGAGSLEEPNPHNGSSSLVCDTASPIPVDTSGPQAVNIPVDTSAGKGQKKKGRSRKSTQSTARTASDYGVEVLESTAGKKWEENDLLVLVAARKDDMTKYREASAQKQMEKADARWAAISVACAAYKVYRTGKQCRDRFEGLMTDFNKIQDWERPDHHSRRSTYWNMDKSEREAQKLPKTFYRSVYDAMYIFCCNKSVNANRTLDSSREDDLSAPTAGGEGNSAVQEADIQSELFGDVPPVTTTASGKKRKLKNQNAISGLVPLLERNHAAMLEAGKDSEAHKQARHVEVLQLEREKMLAYSSTEDKKLAKYTETEGKKIDAISEMSSSIRSLGASIVEAARIARGNI